MPEYFVEFEKRERVVIQVNAANRLAAVAAAQERTLSRQWIPRRVEDLYDEENTSVRISGECALCGRLVFDDEQRPSRDTITAELDCGGCVIPPKHPTP